MKVHPFLLIVAAVVVLSLLNLQPQSIGTPITPKEIRPGQFSNSLEDCELYVAEQKTAAFQSSGANFPVAECKRCPGIDKTSTSRCYLGCGMPCPSGAQCNYPPDCSTNGCSGGICHPIDITYWEPGLRGVCTSANIPLPGYYAYMLLSNEVGTNDAVLLENQYQTACYPPQQPPVGPVGGANWLLIGGIALAGIVGGGYLLSRRKR